ncbi:ATP-binding cassette domain-containing protein [Oscillospiraceae bacterium MB08-C2-2]|nr:ATP-binding cassette domain-containing protein [Oscillospiraceae bacterium MB08-C2-2]
MSLIVDIKKSFGQFVLCIAFEANNGIHAFLGASGCGKSLTLQCIAGIITPDEGHIILDGITLFDSKKKINLSPQQRRAGLLFQSYALFPNMTVEQNIKLGMRNRRKTIRDGSTVELIKMLCLEGLENHYPSQLSGGQQQRVALARMLAPEPRILMLDEPFSALDSYLRWQLEQDVGAVLRSFSGTTLFVSHNRDEVYRMCDYITVVSKGKVSISDEKWALFGHPRTHAAALLTGCKNISPAERIDEYTVLAKDWGITLRSAAPVSKETCFVGIRAKQIQLCGDQEVDNIFQCQVGSFIEDTFSYIRMLRPTFDACRQIRWECSKEQPLGQDAHSVKIYIEPEHVLLLTD